MLIEVQDEVDEIGNEFHWDLQRSIGAQELTFGPARELVARGLFGRSRRALAENLFDAIVLVDEDDNGFVRLKFRIRVARVRTNDEEIADRRFAGGRAIQ